MDLQQVKNTLIFFDNEGGNNKHESSSQLQENSIYNELIEEAGEEVFQHLEQFKLTKDTNFILLSSSKHYLFGPDELKSVKTLVNLKFLNQVNYTNYLLESMNKILPIGGNFVGCFVDKANVKKVQSLKNSSKNNSVLLMNFIENSDKMSFFPITWFKNFFGKRKQFLTSDEVKTMLVKNGFHVSNMTVIQGITYFISNKVFDLKNKASTMNTGSKIVAKSIDKSKTVQR